MLKRFIRNFIFLVYILLSLECFPRSPFSVVEFSGKKFNVLIFRTPAERRQGLSQLHHLSDDTGGLFIYPQESKVSFWMFETHMPLDIFYFNKNKKLIRIIRNAQPCLKKPCFTYPQSGIQYVLETPAGLIRESEIRKCRVSIGCKFALIK